MKVDPNSTVVNVSNKQNENNSVKADDPSQKNKQSASSVVNFSSFAEGFMRFRVSFIIYY